MAWSTDTCRPMWLRGGRAGAMLALAAALVCAFDSSPTSAQQSQVLTFPKRPPQPKPPAPALPTDPATGKAPMLVQAREVHYDHAANRVSAVGDVQIYYSNSTLEADRVVYDQKTKRLHAEGNVRLTEADGRVTRGEIMELSDDYRDGFVDSLRVEMPDDTRVAATRADRTAGNYTVFQSGVYTACEPCKDDPRKPPLWQVSAARVIHDESERMIYFEDARLEFFGKPIAYFPYFSTPDPTVKRKTGFLAPLFNSNPSKYGFAVDIPYFIALAPNYDLTLTPKLTTRQGPLLQGEWRHRLLNGSYSIRAAGIFQLDKDAFLRDDGGPPTPGYRDFRGSLESSGKFSITNRWTWGWDGILVTDKTFKQDYNLLRYRSYNQAQALGVITEGVSQLYLAGRGDRSHFDGRAIHYYGFSESDIQRQLPVIHPVLDYSNVVAQPVAGGEVRYKVNVTSLTREQASFDAISAAAINGSFCAPTTADPAVKTPANCLLRGIPGGYSRMSAEVSWRRTIVDSHGQVFTPFASVQGDVASVSVGNQAGVANFITTGDTELMRAMPTVGLMYRYPFISAQPWGTQTIEPIAQLIVRPDERNIGRLPNEDAQSLVFDDSNLFRVDKFSGYDRLEGGGRLNAGVQYTAQFNQAGFLNALFGQSYHLFGLNSFAVGDITNTGLGSGLETRRSDYVARVAYQPNRILSFSTRARLNEDGMTVRRFEVEARANFDRWSASVLYGNYDAQPELGFLTRREGILATGSVKLDQNWVLMGAARYDIYAGAVEQTRIGIGYVDDCMILAMNYMTNYTYSGNVQTDHRVSLQLSLRTLGGTVPAANSAVP